MLIALALFVVGFFIGRRTTVVWVIPVAVACTALVFAIWVAQDELSWFKLAIWFGYMAALNTGYLFGASVVQATRR
ncbi:MAG: hypothetical protein LCH86_00655 [Proteobacteria bacterium]|uniref:hypothetical protein n=1 Tax=Hyphomicrobiales TaxID=356 RepID=UPI00036DF270|nr:MULTISPECIES: hypothetical protein [Phyllobacteriaceae]MCA0274498.1 hypothetical protein [Pseudomonadota bacterium]MCX8570445.1 hypothetical protein [Aminobacter sp. MET-1]